MSSVPLWLAMNSATSSLAAMLIIQLVTSLASCPPELVKAGRDDKDGHQTNSVTWTVPLALAQMP